MFSVPAADQVPLSGSKREVLPASLPPLTRMPPSASMLSPSQNISWPVLVFIMGAAVPLAGSKMVV